MCRMCGCTPPHAYSEEMYDRTMARMRAAEKSGLRHTAKSWQDLANEIKSRLDKNNGPDNAPKEK